MTAEQDARQVDRAGAWLRAYAAILSIIGGFLLAGAATSLLVYIIGSRVTVLAVTPDDFDRTVTMHNAADWYLALALAVAAVLFLSAAAFFRFVVAVFKTPSD